MRKHKLSARLDACAFVGGIATNKQLHFGRSKSAKRKRKAEAQNGSAPAEVVGAALKPTASTSPLVAS